MLIDHDLKFITYVIPYLLVTLFKLKYKKKIYTLTQLRMINNQFHFHVKKIYYLSLLLIKFTWEGRKKKKDKSLNIFGFG
jgi:hypothetical protein